MTTTFSNEIALRGSIDSMVEEYQAGIEDLRFGYIKLKAAERRIHLAFASDPTESPYEFKIEAASKDLKEIELEFKRAAWRQIVSRLQLRNYMSPKRIEQLDEQIAGRSRYSNTKPEELPEITVANVTAMLETNLNSLGQFMEEKVREIYDWLRPGGWQMEYKTNQASERAGVGRKVIKAYAVERAYSGAGFHVRYHVRDRFVHLDQIFHSLDGKPSPTINNHDGELVQAIADQTKVGEDRFETPYFKGRCFGNGNLHLEFKRADLLDQFNLVAGGARIRPGDSEPSHSHEAATCGAV